MRPGRKPKAVPPTPKRFAPRPAPKSDALAIKDQELERVRQLVQQWAPISNRHDDYDWEAEFGEREPTQADCWAMVEKLSPRQMAYVVLRLRLSQAAAMRAAGIVATATRHVAEWENSPWWPLAVRRELDRLAGNKREVFEPMLPAAQSRLFEEVSGQHGDKLAHEAAVYILDQGLGKASATTVEGKDAAPDAEAVADAFVDFIKQATEANARARAGAVVAEVRELPQNASGSPDNGAET